MAMRQLTSDERIARDVAKSSSDVPYLADDLEHYIFDTGFTAALDHAAAQIAALQAERDALREAQFKAVKDLKRMARHWQRYANDHYCQTYNPEMGKGLRRAAGNLDDYINGLYGPLCDTIRLATGARK